MPTDTEWRDRTKSLLKAELKRKDVSYKELAEKLTALGAPDSERNISNKLSRGSFTAVFMLQVLDTIDVQELRLK